MKLARGKTGYSGGFAKNKRLRADMPRGHMRKRARNLPHPIIVDPVVQKILERAAMLAGSKDDAASWYETQLLPSFGYRTPRALVADGLADAVIRYLAALEDGGYA